MFATLSLKELQQLVRELRAHHTIKGFSRMKKEELIAELSSKFVYLDGSIYLKGEDKDRLNAQKYQDAKDAKAQAEAPAVTAKPRAKKAAPKKAAPKPAPLTKEQSFKQTIIAFLDKAETDMTPKEARKQYQIQQKIELKDSDKTFFNAVLREWKKNNDLLA
jgi:hypothetical protein